MQYFFHDSKIMYAFFWCDFHSYVLLLLLLNFVYFVHFNERMLCVVCLRSLIRLIWCDMSSAVQRIAGQNNQKHVLAEGTSKSFFWHAKYYTI